MRNFIRLISSVLSSLFLWACTFSTVHAAGTLDTALTNLKNTNASGTAGARGELPVVIGNIVSVALGSAGIIFVVLIVQAGILYLTAAGDTAKVDKAKKMITQSVIGLIIMVAAYSISSFVINQLSTATAS